MAVTHYNSFREILSLFPYKSPNDINSFSTPIYSPNISILGLSYESDILISPISAYNQIIDFLLFPESTQSHRYLSRSRSPVSSSSSTSSLLFSNSSSFPSKNSKSLVSPRSNYKKGMSCSLSHLLVNYEEFLCTFTKYDKNHPLNPLLWMTSNDDTKNQNITFAIMMKSWHELSKSSEFQKMGYLEECSLNDILETTYIPSLYHDKDEIDYLKKYLEIIQYYSKSHSQLNGYCGNGGFTKACHSEGLTAIPSDRLEYCHLSLYRSKCNVMTIQNQKCYFHFNSTHDTNYHLESSPSASNQKNQHLTNSEYHLEKCDQNSYTIHRVQSII